MIRLIRIQSWFLRKHRVKLYLLSIFALAGLYSLYQGYAYKEKQIDTIAAFRAEKQAALEDLVKNFNADTATAEGRLAYHKVNVWSSVNWNTVLPAYKTPNTTAIYAIGQADVMTFYYTVKLESFFMQLFKQNEIANPLRSLAGHFDTNFWVVYLLPLLIIVLCFNIFSSELDNSNWKLIESQGVTAKQWIGSTLILVWLCVELILMLVFLSGMALNYFQFHQMPAMSDLAYFIVVHLYIVFWLAALYLINSFAMNTSASALSAGVLWVMVCIVMPTLVTTVAEKSIQVDNTVISRMSRRPQDSRLEDTTYVSKLIADYKVQRPQYKDGSIKSRSKSIGFAKYMAYHEMVDDTNAIAVSYYFKQIEKRQHVNNASIMINPASAVDGILAGLASNDARSNHEFIWKVKSFHQKMHDVMFPSVFADRVATRNDFENLPIFDDKSETSMSYNILICLVGLVGVTLLIITLANRKLRG